MPSWLLPAPRTCTVRPGGHRDGVDTLDGSAAGLQGLLLCQGSTLVGGQAVGHGVLRHRPDQTPAGCRTTLRRGVRRRGAARQPFRVDPHLRGQGQADHMPTVASQALCLLASVWGCTGAAVLRQQLFNQRMPGCRLPAVPLFAEGCSPLRASLQSADLAAHVPRVEHASLWDKALVVHSAGTRCWAAASPHSLCR